MSPPGGYKQAVWAKGHRHVSGPIRSKHPHAILDQFRQHALDRMAVAVGPHAHDRDPRVHVLNELVERRVAPMMWHLQYQSRQEGRLVFDHVGL